MRKQKNKFILLLPNNINLTIQSNYVKIDNK